jgi:hypothetical protein
MTLPPERAGQETAQPAGEVSHQRPVRSGLDQSLAGELETSKAVLRDYTPTYACPRWPSPEPGPGTRS